MRMTVTAQNGVSHRFKGRHIGVRVKDGVLEIFDAHSQATLLVMQQGDLGEIITKGKPKAKKKPKDSVMVRLMSDIGKSQRDGDGLVQMLAQKLAELTSKQKVEQMTIDVDVTTPCLQALINEIEIDLQSEDGLLKGALQGYIDKQNAGMQVAIDSLSTRIEVLGRKVTIAHPEAIPAKQPATVAKQEQEPVEDPNPSLEPHFTADPYLPGHRSVEGHQKDDSRCCRKCGKMHRHSVNCEYYMKPDEVQNDQCDEALGKSS